MPLNDTKPAPSRLIDWSALVRQTFGPEFNQPDVAYRFSKEREFKATDMRRVGVYTPLLNGIDQETQDATNLQYPNILTEADERLGQE